MNHYLNSGAKRISGKVKTHQISNSGELTVRVLYTKTFLTTRSLIEEQVQVLNKFSIAKLSQTKKKEEQKVANVQSDSEDSGMCCTQ
jgi:predicted Zn-dependent protease